MSFRYPTLFILLGLATMISLSGCGATDSETGHVHGENDALVWPLKEKIEGTDVEVWLGHHGDHFHPGDMIEPAAIVTRAGKPLSNIVVTFHEGPNDPNVMVYGGASLLFEPETAEEPAHYAGLKLNIPLDAKDKLVICFQVELPADAGGKIIRDVEVKLGHE